MLLFCLAHFNKTKCIFINVNSLRVLQTKNFIRWKWSRGEEGSIRQTDRSRAFLNSFFLYFVGYKVDPVEL